MTEQREWRNIICNTEDEKYDLLAIIHGVNKDIATEPSGYGEGYYIAFECTSTEYAEIAQRWLWS